LTVKTFLLSDQQSSELSYETK